MVHADFSSLPAHLRQESSKNKMEFYEHLSKTLGDLLQGEKNWVVNLSNSSSVLFNAYRETNGGNGRGINWTGFYLLPHLFPSAPIKKASSPLTPFSSIKLILGPFQGRPACQHITLPSILPNSESNPNHQRIKTKPSVCASAFLDRIPKLIKDVSKFPGHITCDSQTKSELVLPLLIKRAGVVCCVGVLDLDCTLLDGFDQDDIIGLNKFLNVLIDSTEWW